MRYAGRLSKLSMKVAREYNVGVISTVMTSSWACAFSTMSFKTPTHLPKKIDGSYEEKYETTHLIKEAGELVCPLKFTSAMNVIDDTNRGNR
jgi:hypothetical protein